MCVWCAHRWAKTGLTKTKLAGEPNARAVVEIGGQKILLQVRACALACLEVRPARENIMFCARERIIVC